MKLPLFQAIALAALLSCCVAEGGDRASGKSRATKSAIDGVDSRRVAAIVGAMSLEEKCAQLFMVAVAGDGKPSPATAGIFKSIPFGAVVLFGYNVPREAIGIAALAYGLQDIAERSGSGVPLFIAIDHEGGSVFRFKKGISRLPSPLAVGVRQNPAETARELGRIAGTELRSLGINMNLAPVVEAIDDGSKAFLGSRSYSREGSTVDAAAGGFAEGLAVSGVAAVAKHFPGNSGGDPHKLLPSLESSEAELRSAFFPRFRSAVEGGVPAVMLSHVLVPAFDPGVPATLSSRLVRGVLKGELGFAGIALSDDMLMKALSSGTDSAEAAIRALEAGIDMLMVTGMGEAVRIYRAVFEALRSGRLSLSRLDDAVSRIIAQKLRFELWTEFDRSLRLKRLSAFPALLEADERTLSRLGVK